jgi:hypothetical protein
MQQPSDRLGLTSFLEHAFGNDVSLFAELLYSRNETQMIMAPTGCDPVPGDLGYVLPPAYVPRAV